MARPQHCATAAAARDLSVSDGAFRTLSALSTFADRDGGCHPSVSALAAAVGKTRQAVQRHLRELEAAGYLSIESRHREDGSAASNRYRLEAPNGGPHERRPPATSELPPCHAEVAGPCNAEVAPRTTYLNPIHYEHVQLPLDPPATPPAATASPPLNAPPVGARSPQADDLFECFWRAYPKRKGRAEAEKAFARAIKGADFETILAGAEAYAERCRRAGTEERFIKYAQGWLNGRRWEDEAPGRKPGMTANEAAMATLPTGW